MAKKKRIWYHISLYEEYPIYEPAEGGYYYAGVQLIESYKVGSLKKARKIMRNEAKRLGFENIYSNHSCTDSPYIGDRQHIYVETVRGIHESGRKLYC